MEYTLIRSERKTIAIHIGKNKEVTIKAPLYLGAKEIDSFIFKHEKWIESKLKALEEDKKKAALLKENQEIYLYGEKYKIAEGKIRIDYESKVIFLPIKRDLDFLYKAEMKKAVEDLVVKWSFYSQPEKLRYKKQKTVWGSCTSKGTINLNYLLIKAPKEVLEYIYIHELVHLKIKNHSQVFWNEVGKLLPSYKKSKAWLKANGQLISL